jgi:uncharacterized protein (TIGR01777 family)
MAVIGVTGGTGFIGSALTPLLLKAGHEVIIFSRSPRPPANIAAGVRYGLWNPATEDTDAALWANVEQVVHLAGAGVADQRWSKGRKAEIVRSRVQGTQFLLATLRKHAPQCKTLVAASAIGYYGPDKKGGAPFSEEDLPAADFLARACIAWEEEIFRATDFLRVVALRTGIVLGKGGGALPEFTRAFPMHIAPILGSGKQVVSWIHEGDLVRLYEYMLTEEKITGVYNAVAPHPVSQRALMDALVKAKGGTFLKPPVPAFALKIAMGEMSVEVLKSCTVSAAKVVSAGVQFLFPTIEEAAGDLV